MAAGVTDKLWKMSDRVQVIEAWEAKRDEHKKLSAVTPEGAWSLEAKPNEHNTCNECCVCCQDHKQSPLTFVYPPCCPLHDDYSNVAPRHPLKRIVGKCLRRMQLVDALGENQGIP
jgi:hypothetical protein